ncbi:hypothetical protein BH20ACT20_BH20ACT20_07220 [soil metagenome]
MGDEDPTTEELRLSQLRRETDEREAASEAPDDDTAENHIARADKAAYLRQKLEERARAEREKG